MIPENLRLSEVYRKDGLGRPWYVATRIRLSVLLRSNGLDRAHSASLVVVMLSTVAMMVFKPV